LEGKGRIAEKNELKGRVDRSVNIHSANIPLSLQFPTLLSFTLLIFLPSIPLPFSHNFFPLPFNSHFPSLQFTIPLPSSYSPSPLYPPKLNFDKFQQILINPPVPDTIDHLKKF